jgi:hypothetical protein
VLVGTNWDAVMSNDLDLSALAGIPSSSTVCRTTVNKDATLQEGSIKLSANSHLIDRLPVRSITTCVIDGVSLLSIPASVDRFGRNEVVPEHQSTPRGAEDAILPYPCWQEAAHTAQG